MNDSTYTEFKLAVTASSLEVTEYEPCEELQAICHLLDADELNRSPAELYPAMQPIRQQSRSRADVFMNLDLTDDPTDQMDMVGISIRCCSVVADQVENQLRRIRARSEVKSALLRGNLGLMDNH